VREVILTVDDKPYGSPDEAVKTPMLRSALQRQNLPVKFIKLSQNYCKLIIPLYGWNVFQHMEKKVYAV
jgi:hypothetical protein